MNPRAARLLPLLFVFLVCCFALLAWGKLGLYPDEYAYRVHLWRYFQDHGVVHGLYSLCESRVQQVPWLFLPPAMVLSALDLALDPSQARFGYLLVVAGTYAVVLMATRNAPNRWGPVLLTASVVGVAGSALVLVRHEAALTLHLLACLVGWQAATRDWRWRVAAAALVALTALASLYSHLQGLLFLPLAALVLYRLLAPGIRPLPLIGGLLVSFGYAAFETLRFNRLACPEQPKLERFFQAMLVKGDESWHWGLRTVNDKWWEFVTAMLYRKQYGARYLPGIPDAADGATVSGTLPWKILNFAVVATVSVILLAAAAIVVHALVDLVRRRLLAAIARGAPVAGHLVPVLIVLPTLALIAVDAQQNFYRSIYLNFLLSIAAALYVASVPREERASMLSGALVLATALASTVANHVAFGDRLLQELGPSVSAATDWKGVDADVSALAASCGVKPEDRNVVLNDDTYNALKHREHVMPLTYVLLQGTQTGLAVPDVATRARASFVLARCNMMEATGVGWPAQVSRGRLCCTHFPPPAP